jgi:hypothetical protein
MSLASTRIGAAIVMAATLAACAPQGTRTEYGTLSQPAAAPSAGLTTAPVASAGLPGGQTAQNLAIVRQGELLVQPYDLTVDKIHRMDVMTQGDEQIGDIEHVLTDPAGRVVAMTVSTGGILGLGAREYIVPLNELTLQGNRFVTRLSRTQLESQPVFGNPQR